MHIRLCGAHLIDVLTTEAGWSCSLVSKKILGMWAEDLILHPVAHDSVNCAYVTDSKQRTPVTQVSLLDH